MTVDLSAVKSAKELSTAISGNASVPAQEEQATPLENWREQEYIALHNQIMAHGRNACESILYMAQDLKRMNTEKLYEAGGYASFEEYTEKAVGLKKTQAYKYISAYDSLGEEFFRSSGKIGITKIALLAGLTEDERAALQEKADIESATVRELKEQISQLRGELDEKEQRIGELEWNASAAGLTAPDNAAELEKAEQAAQAARAEAAAAKADATKLKERVEALKKDKQALEEKLKSPAVQTIENPETEAERDRALAAIAEKDAEIERLQKQLMIAGDARAMIHGAILRTDRLSNETTEAIPFSGDGVCVFRTDGVSVEGDYYGDKSTFYKNNKAAMLDFFASVMDMLGEQIYEQLGREELIRLQNNTLALPFLIPLKRLFAADPASRR